MAAFTGFSIFIDISLILELGVRKIFALNWPKVTVKTFIIL